MTDPYARPDEPERKAPDGAPQDETIPIVPEGGYSSQPSPWSEGNEQTAVDPLAQGYTNPSLGQPQQPYAQPQQQAYPQQPYAQQPYPQQQPYPSAQQPAYGYQPPAATYEQPPTTPGYGGVYEPARDAPRPAPMVPSYQVGYPGMQLLPDHPNAIPAFVLALLGFVVGITFPIAWFLGAKGTTDMKRQPGRWRPSPMMTVGKIIGMIGTILMALGVGLMVLLIIGLASA